MPDDKGRLRCGEFGHLGKKGTPCQYVIYRPATACMHHTEDKTRQTEVLERARRASKEASVPDIDTHNFATIADCLRVRAQVVKELTTKSRPDVKKLDLILKATSGASADHGVAAQQRTNEILLMLDGHGAGVAALQRLRESSVRVLPGRKNLSVVKGDRECGNEVEAAVIEVSKKEST